MAKVGEETEFIPVINDILTVYRQAAKSFEKGELEMKSIGFEDIVHTKQAIEDLKRADLYYMGDEFDDMLMEYANQFAEIYSTDIRFSEFTRPPAAVCYIRPTTLRHWSHNETVGCITRYFEDGVTVVTTVCALSKPEVMGGYHPHRGIYLNANKEEVDTWPKGKLDAYVKLIVVVAGAFEIINNPRFITSKPAGTRQQRRDTKKREGIAVEAWHEISWNIDEPVEIEGGDRGGWRMPLHYTRGHFRRGQPHWEGIVEKNGQYYKWIDGFWSGHPAYGIKKGYHAPKIGALAS